MTHLHPSEDQLAAFRDLPTDAPIEMLNLLRFRAAARYPEGHGAAPCTGAEAYHRYLDAAGAVTRRLGLDVIWSATPALTLIGPADEAWDMAFIARYPDARAFLAMIADPDYRAATVHRTAALADSRLIRCVPIALQKD
ncbi:DUF1330 domain-containing protein [Sphingomicrobium astaxanthinifaciens]|uniref:DUF1330 domain-containing protein n=1 Tax=Sphingomicrobium astaxanthinifaciens TaxID=1227949 RepID=UPI001FCC7824|nr:DUF1330 domain-containing protein [Sphingomicrobium astaxanthinifaciens]MCJ7421464.1 DUF1330 domain-containing protein [Sphingomicrobium astaxanthinifaciens]